MYSCREATPVVVLEVMMMMMMMVPVRLIAQETTTIRGGAKMDYCAGREADKETGSCQTPVCPPRCLTNTWLCQEVGRSLNPLRAQWWEETRIDMGTDLYTTLEL